VVVVVVVAAQNPNQLGENREINKLLFKEVEIVFFLLFNVIVSAPMCHARGHVFVL